MALRTRLNEMLDIEHPIISAPMAFVAGGHLAATITGVGGLGLIGGGYGDAEWLEREFAEARNARVGCGFITWSLARRPQLLNLVLAHAPVAVMLSFGSPMPFARPIKNAGARLICQVQCTGPHARGHRRWSRHNRSTGSGSWRTRANSCNSYVGPRGRRLSC